MHSTSQPDLVIRVAVVVKTGYAFDKVEEQTQVQYYYINKEKAVIYQPFYV